MGAQLRVYKRRIKSVTATKKITKAMEMIAASRIVKAQRQVAASTPYATELTRAVTAVATGSTTKHPLTTEAETPTRAAVLLVTSDRGLAGGYSSNAIKAAERLTERLRGEGKEVDTYIVGRKGVAYYGFRERKVTDSWSGFTDSPTYADAKQVAAPLIAAVQQDTAEGGVDELHIVFTEFVSMLTQTPVQHRLLPLSLTPASAGAAEESTGTSAAAATGKSEILPLFDFEPSAEDVLDALLPRYVESRIYNALLQAAASKHAATRRAMKSATDNAGDLIKSLSRLANAARQAEITQEISEIVGGASALADATAGSEN
ncbi:F0F1 ATP synthase subunit gamma [Streptomyces sp. NPDC094034]|uniref:F0F1 ATP synthase subunit gamma n=1 Tax=Streptomyces sp. NPDC094034 TaxID=3155309 RepID=UPI0033313E87